MKFALCQKCQGIAVPFKRGREDSGPKDNCICPCKASIIIYTGNKNEVSVSGPCKVLAVTDAEWEELLNPLSEDRHAVTIWTVPREAGTVIDLDKEVPTDGSPDN